MIDTPLILVVDDDPILQRATARLLSQGGYRTRVAGDGQTGLEIARAAKPDLILLDVNLPDATGFDVCRLVKSDPVLAGCLVLLLSGACTSPESRVTGLEGGADGYIVRPVTNEELLARVRGLLRIKQVENGLRESEERLREVLENSLDASYKRNLRTNAYHYLSPVFARLTGYTPDEMMTLPVETVLGFMHPEDAVNVERVLAEATYDPGGTPYHVEYRFKHKDGQYRWLHDQFTVMRDAQGQPVACIGSVSDITDRKQAEAYQEMSRQVLQILNEPGDLPGAIQCVLAVIKTRTGFDAVGIRLQDGDDYPYYAQEGFGKDFLRTENMLTERAADGGVCRDQDGNVRLECTCGLVISDKTDRSSPYFTQGGSCWSNDKAGAPFQDTRRAPRDRCLHDGFQSVALVPIRNKDRVVGLIQLNDKRKGRLTLEMVELLEGIASHIGSALMRKRAEEMLAQERNLLRTLIDHLPEMVYIKDAASRYVMNNRRHLESLGVTNQADSIGKTSFDFFPEPMAAEYYADEQELIRTGQPVIDKEEEVQNTVTGRMTWHRTTKVPLRDGQGKLVGLVGLSRDVTASRKTDEALRESEALQRTLLTTLPVGVIIVDAASRRIEHVNNAAAVMFGAPEERIIGQRCHAFLCPAAERACPICDLGHKVDNAEKEMLCADGRGRPVLKSVKCISIGGKEKLIECIVDISDRKRAEDDLRRTKDSLAVTNRELQLVLEREQKLARMDALTGVGNRLAFFEFAERQFQIAARYHHPLAIIILDLDRFKVINDTIGHAAGDRALVRIAQAVRAQLRAPDLIARYGGEEFVALLPDTDVAQAVVLAERIREFVADLVIDTGSGEVQVTLSIGIASLAPADDSIDKLVQRADEALYAAKEAGRNRVAVWQGHEDLARQFRDPAQDWQGG